MQTKVLLFILSVLVAFNVHGALSSDSSNGTIMELNIQARTILVNQTQYGLSDNVVILSTANTLLSQANLAVGQKIEFTTANQQQALGMTNPELPSTIITKIHVLSGWEASKAPKQ